MNTNIKNEIDQRLRFIARDTISYYITEQRHKFKPTNFSVRIPIYRDGKRTSRYLGSYETFEEAVIARDYALRQIEKSDELSLTIPPEMSRLGNEGMS